MERYGYGDAQRARDLIHKGIEQAGWDPEKVEEGLILGTGMGNFSAKHLHPTRRVVMPFEYIFNTIGCVTEESNTVEGHKKEVIIAPLAGEDPERSPLLFVQNGREHLYQGVDPKRATFWIRVMQLMGVHVLGTSSAVGVITPETVRVPQIVLVHSENDDIGDSPLIGPNEEEFGPRFQDLNDMYPEATRRAIRKVAKEQGIDLVEGLYIRTATSPSFERPEDVYRMRRVVKDIWEEGRLQPGEDRFDGEPTAVVGMTVPPESVVVHHARRSQKYPAFQDGYFVLAAATDYAGAVNTNGFVSVPTHEEVQERAHVLQEDFGNLVKGTLQHLRTEQFARAKVA